MTLEMSEFAHSTSFLLQYPVSIVDLYNRAARNLGRPMTDELIRLDAGRLFNVADPDLFKQKAGRFLHHLAAIGDRYPDLTVKWATYAATLSSLKGLSVTEDAIELALAYAEAAYAIKPGFVQNKLTACWCATQNRQLRGQLVALGYHLEPQTIPGPWGIREEGMAFLSARQERERTLLERFGDLKHRILHPPGPDSITLDR